MTGTSRPRWRPVFMLLGHLCGRAGAAPKLRQLFLGRASFAKHWRASKRLRCWFVETFEGIPLAEIAEGGAWVCLWFLADFTPMADDVRFEG
jgi:hypothetical protein